MAYNKKSIFYNDIKDVLIWWYMRKKEAEEIERVLKENKIWYFYHFTDKSNIPSIKEHGGLFSWQYLKNHEIEIPNQGGDSTSMELDMKNKLDDYVRLSFTPSHPMAYRKIQEGAEIVVLKISRKVALFKTTKFSDMNANDNGHSHGGNLEDLLKVNFKATQRKFVKADDPEFKQTQAECLVKRFIPKKYILNLDDF